jgi:hypothetical protein
VDEEVWFSNEDIIEDTDTVRGSALEIVRESRVED